MSRWFRFYDDSLNNPKVQKLPAELFKAWVNILCIASKGDGAIVRSDVAFAMRCRDEEADLIIAQLILRNLLEDRGDFLTPHDWDERQFKSDVTDPTAAKRMKALRSRNRNAVTADDRNATVTVTATRTDTEQNRTEAKTEKKADPELRSVSWPDGFLEFFCAYPKKVGKKDAAKAYSLACREVSRETILASLNKILPTWRDPKYIPHPATWLRRGGFYDEPSVSSGAIERHSANDPLAGII